MSEQHGGWDFADSGAAPVGGLGTLGGGGSDLPPPDGPPPASAGGWSGRRRGRGPGSGGDAGRRLLRGAGEVLVTAGLVLLLFVVYEVWVSNLFADRRQHQVHQQLATEWKKGQDPLKGEDRLDLPIGKQVVLPLGQGFANLYIPAFGKDYAKTVIQGTSDGDLDQGPGHYVNTQVPGQIGNFAVAGHRVGKGEPFLNLDQLVPGDKIVVQTATNWYVYTVLGSQSDYQAALKLQGSARSAAITAALAATDSQGVPGREIVSPGAVGVILPVPDHADETPTRALLTLTTCHPKYTANQRMIIHAALTRAVAVQGSALPRELSGGTI
jgi:sortase A